MSAPCTCGAHCDCSCGCSPLQGCVCKPGCKCDCPCTEAVTMAPIEKTSISSRVAAKYLKMKYPEG